MFEMSLSLAACMGWGIADFLGGLKSRHLPAVTVLMLSNIFGMTVITLIVCLRGKAIPGDPALLWAVASGITGIAGMLMLYRGLAIGTMSIIAPISATGVILPVIVGITLGDTLSGLQMLGIGAAVTGTILVAREKDANNSEKRVADGVKFAVGAAVAAGLYFVFMDRASEADPYWAAFIMRLSIGVFLIPIFILTRPSLRINRYHFPVIVCIGIVDALASFAFALATTVGMLSLVSVVGALYPAVTVFLSAIILRERLQKAQTLGVVLAIMGVALISSG
jgi:drug/metabolite transporter (DMT)-like permease